MPREPGFSLIEIVIAMFVLALMAMALFPLLVGAMRASNTNRDMVEATTIANTLLTDARREGASGCSALTSWAGRSDLTPSGSALAARANVGNCSVPLPAAVVVSVRIYPADDDSRTLIELSTKVMVE